MYYIELRFEDGSTSEIELKPGSIYCKCIRCGQKFSPSDISFNDERMRSSEWVFAKLCGDCLRNAEAEREQQMAQKCREELAKVLSRTYKKEITPDDVNRLVSDAQRTGRDVMALQEERFGPAPRKERPQKERNSPTKKHISIIPATRSV